MGFANIWATKAEFNGKGQRRWCVSSPSSRATFRPGGLLGGEPCFSSAFCGSAGPRRRPCDVRSPRCATKRLPDTSRRREFPNVHDRGGLGSSARRATRRRKRAILGFQPGPPLVTFASLTSLLPPLSPQQPSVREPVGYHSQVQPEHLQAVLPRVRQGYRLREGASRLRQP